MLKEALTESGVDQLWVGPFAAELAELADDNWPKVEIFSSSSKKAREDASGEAEGGYIEEDEEVLISDLLSKHSTCEIGEQNEVVRLLSPVLRRFSQERSLSFILAQDSILDEGFTYTLRCAHDGRLTVQVLFRERIVGEAQARVDPAPRPFAVQLKHRQFHIRRKGSTAWLEMATRTGIGSIALPMFPAN